MTKNLSALIFMEENSPELAQAYKEQLREAKRMRSRIRQKAMAKAYAKEKENRET
jgi:spore coat protein CotF